MTTRRKFLQFGAVAAIGGMFSGLSGRVFGQFIESGSASVLPAQSFGDPMLSLGSQHFQPFVDTVFEVRNSQLQEGATMWLKQVKDYKSEFNKSEGHDMESFSLHFEPSTGNGIPQGTYEFEHAELGKLSMFIAPASPDPSCHEVIVCRLNS